MPKGGGRYRYPVPPPVPEAERTKPTIRVLTPSEAQIPMGCDRVHGYGEWSRAECHGKANATASHRVTYHNNRKDRKDTAWVCRACALDFVRYFNLELP